jgi:peptidoglycan-associated lipoprotein
MNLKKILSCVSLALVLTACSQREATIQMAPVEQPAYDPYADDPYNVAAGSQEDFEKNVGDRIFFGFDRYDVSHEARESLQSQAAWLRQYPNVKIMIAGHCDVRGTREYNLGLGERRANSAKKYLMSLGISSDRLQTISYGKDRPEAIGNSSEDHARNRRAVSMITEGAM